MLFKIIAKESRAVGIHWNFSPVVDVNNNPANPIINVRSFSEDPDMVIDYGIQFIRKDLNENNIIKALWSNVTNTKLSTTISNQIGISVSTIEHLMSALSGLHIDNL